MEEDLQDSLVHLDPLGLQEAWVSLDPLVIEDNLVYPDRKESQANGGFQVM